MTSTSNAAPGPTIRVRDLGFHYDDGAPALEGLSFELDAGETLGLVGANGSGKSTLLAILAGLFSPTRGRVTVGGVSSPGDENEIRKLTGLVQQDVDLQILGATVEEDMLLGHRRSEETVAVARSLAARFGLDDAWQQPVQTLSWGQKRKLCIAAMLLTRPEVLLLDEPFGGLDYPSILEMQRILRQNRDDQVGRRITQVVAVHDLEPVADLVDRWLVLADGRLALAGAASDVFDRLEEFGVRTPPSWRAGRGIESWG